MRVNDPLPIQFALVQLLGNASYFHCTDDATIDHPGKRAGALDYSVARVLLLPGAEPLRTADP